MHWKIIAAQADVPKPGFVRFNVEYRLDPLDVEPLTTQDVDVQPPLTDAIVEAACVTVARSLDKAEMTEVSPGDLTAFLLREGTS